MGFFGSKPKLRKRSAGYKQLANQSAGLAAVQHRFDVGTQAGLRDLAGGRKSDRKAIIDSQAADAQFAQKGQATGANDITENAIRRAKGLSGVVNATNTEFDQRILQERIASTGGAMKRRGVGLRALAQAGNLEDALASQKQITSDVKSDIRAEQLGALGGAVAGAINPEEGDGIFDLFKKPPGDPAGFVPGQSQSKVQGGADGLFAGFKQ